MTVENMARLEVVIARSVATKQSILPLRSEMDYFAEPVIGRAFARPVGSHSNDGLKMRHLLSRRRPA